MSEQERIATLEAKVANLERQAKRCPMTDCDGRGHPCLKDAGHNGGHVWFTGQFTGTGDPFYDHS